MILKKYIQFINEKISKIEVDEYNSAEMHDVMKAGLSIDEDGTLRINTEQNELKNLQHLHEYGELIYDLTTLGNNCLDINADYAKLITFNGLPLKCYNFTASHNNIKNLKGGPDQSTSYIVNGNIYLTSFEGAPSYCKSFESKNTSITNCLYLDNISSEEVTVILSNNNKLESLEGLPYYTKTLDVSNCINLESLEGIPDGVENLNINGCIKLKTLYDIKDLDRNIFDVNIKDSGITSIESSYFIYNKKNGEKYYEGLFNHAKSYGIDELGSIYFPLDFLESLSSNDKELLRSLRGITKFKL